MTKTTKYPLDFAALEAGSIISTEEVECAIHRVRNEDPSAFDQQAYYFSHEVTRRLRREGSSQQQHLKALYNKSAGVMILAAEQHKEYCRRGYRRALRTLMIAAAEVHMVNRAELPRSGRKDLDRLASELSLVVGSVTTARRTFRLSKPNNPMRIAAQKEDQP